MTARKVSVLNSMQHADSCKLIPEICQKIISMGENRYNHSTVIELQSDDRVDKSFDSKLACTVDTVSL